ncbi:hypothetical protein Hanom_Chr01g00042501 [Helianthus anomalus]
MILMRLRFFDPHIRKNSHEMNNFWAPFALLGPAKHQERVRKVGIEAHEDMPHRVALRVDWPAGYLVAAEAVT